MSRLSDKQRSLLEEAANNGTYEGKPIPLYLPHWSRVDSFVYESDLFRYVQKIADKGLIEFRDKCFVSLTKEGHQEILRGSR